MTDWSRAFDDPIALPDGRELVRLSHAAELCRSCRRRRTSAEWQTAVRILIAAAEGRDFMMHARIAMTKALSANHG